MSDVAAIVFSYRRLSIRIRLLHPTLLANPVLTALTRLVELRARMLASRFDIDDGRGVVNANMNVNGVLFGHGQRLGFVDVGRGTSGQFG